MQPSKQSSIWTVDQDSRTLSNYRSARNTVRWAYLYNYFSDIANIVLGFIVYSSSNSSNYASTDTGNALSFLGISAIGIGIILFVLAFFISRRSRIVAGISIGFGVINSVVLIYYFLHGSAVTAASNTGVGLYFNVRAYNAIPDVLAYEQRAKSWVGAQQEDSRFHSMQRKGESQPDKRLSTHGACSHQR